MATLYWWRLRSAYGLVSEVTLVEDDRCVEHPHGQVCQAVHAQEQLYAWSVRHGGQTQRVHCGVQCWCVSIYVLSSVESIVLWNRETGVMWKTLEKHSKFVNGIVVHPSNPLQFVSYSSDGSLIV
jgi:WD40 repeat protein